MRMRPRDEDALQALRTARIAPTTIFARANCPFCLEAAGKEDRQHCLSVNLSTGRYHCWRCKTWGYVELPDDMRVLKDTAPVEANKVIGLPEDFTPLWKQPGLSADYTLPAREYLTKRGIGCRELWAFAGIGCCVIGRYAGRVVVPVTAPDGRQLGWVARAWYKGAERKYLNAPGMSLGAAGALFNEAALLVESEDPVLVVEGVFDALAYWPDAVAVLGKPTSRQLDTLTVSKRPVVLVLDGDAWQENEMYALQLRMAGKTAGWVRLPPCMDPDQVNRQWLREAACDAYNNAALDAHGGASCFA